MNILKFIRNLFKPKFSIEVYPHTGKYLPKVGSFYMNQFKITGFIRKETWIIVADSFLTKKEAEKHIILYKEQQLKKGVKTILIND